MRIFLLSVACVLLYGCSNDIDMFLPRGPEGTAGEPGRSAYELWVEAVGNGIIQWSEETDPSGFFRYLKGEKGDAGTGTNGQSAYELWTDMVAEGIEDPRNAPNEWDRNETDMDDFFRFLTGKDGAAGTGTPGKSAWALWVDDVTDADGLDNPHTPAIDEWPRNKVLLTDFWRYLHGDDGSQGISGLSAYDVWKELVADGTVDWDEGTGPDDFFRFLKGKDGVRGENGKDGAAGVPGLEGAAGEDGIDGKTAYDIWKEAVLSEEGIADPHNPGTNWPTDKTSEKDFYRYMTGKDGADGISAYGLWVLDVRKGIIENPHAPGMWPDDQTTLMDFWHYLRGEDGEDGETPAPIVVPGGPGTDVTPVPGKANVIAEYQQQAYSEYVKTSTGGVVYTVYIDNQTVAPAGVTVRNMPGIPGETFMTDANGQFEVPAAQLPTSGTIYDRYDSAQVTYTKSNGESVTDEPSAANTYVPQRIRVRLRIGRDDTAEPVTIVSLGTVSTQHLNGGAFMSVPVTLQRKISDTAEWEDIPDYLDDIDRYVGAYECDPTDPSDYDINSPLLLRDTDEDALTGSTVSVRRPTLRWTAMAQTWQEANYNLWNNADHWFTMVVEDYYGEDAYADAVIKVAPVQFHPLPTGTAMKNYRDHASGGSGTDGDLTWTGGSYDKTSVNTDLLFATNYTSTPQTGFTLYEPVQETPNNQSHPFRLAFRSLDELNIWEAPTSTYGHPEYTLSSEPKVYLHSHVMLRATSRLFVGPGDLEFIGTLEPTDASKTAFEIVPSTNYTFAPIPITYN